MKEFKMNISLSGQLWETKVYKAKTEETAIKELLEEIENIIPGLQKLILVLDVEEVN